ncbi:hypothetical protein MGSAQ_000876 [marine sediment metagenome]|uniref:Uncharacterized protein n=1 Tax=marine sediment metagenome TaxID=412755 RepID=A0A1B6NWA8_9ZZZZ
MHCSSCATWRKFWGITARSPPPWRPGRRPWWGRCSRWP